MKILIPTSKPILLLEEDSNRGFFLLQPDPSNSTNIYIGFNQNLTASNAECVLSVSDSLDGSYKGKIYALAASGTPSLYVSQGPNDELKRPPII